MGRGMNRGTGHESNRRVRETRAADRLAYLSAAEDHHLGRTAVVGHPKDELAAEDRSKGQQSAAGRPMDPSTAQWDHLVADRFSYGACEHPHAKIRN